MGPSKRTVFKLSRESSEEEIRKCIATLYNIPVELLPEINFGNYLKAIDEKRTQVDRVIEEYKNALDLNTKDGKAKLAEAIDVGKFILSYDPALQLTPPDANLKYPDFIVRDGRRSIGVEHTRLLSREQQHVFKKAKSIIERAEQKVREQLSGASFTGNVFLDFRMPIIDQQTIFSNRFSEEHLDSIANTIADAVRLKQTEEQYILPPLITDILIASNSDNRIDLVLGEVYFTVYDFRNALSECIARKEQRIDKYRNAAKTDELWLLIIIDDINSPSGYFLDDELPPKIAATNFDAIWLFEKYNGRFMNLKFSSNS